nr:SprT-like domain-containing protein [Bacteroidota bacterium]
MPSSKEILIKYIPAEAVDPVVDLLEKHHVHLRIARKRKTKLGDYRPPVNGYSHRISINYDLNAFAFLITFLHEMAHLVVWEKYKNKARPHGCEWEGNFRFLLNSFNEKNIFPAEIAHLIQNNQQKLFASFYANDKLSRLLKNWDTGKANITVEQIPENGLFKLSDGRVFKKLGKRRKNYLCFCLSNKRRYIFNPLAEVFVAKSDEN